MNFVLKDISDIDTAAKIFVEKFGDKKIFAFYGEMGAGKTTFIKAVCKSMEVTGTITSPTFSLVNEYETDNGMTIYHFDFYRIENIEEVYDFGYEDYFYSDKMCFIEWPELVETLLPEDVVEVKISVDDNEQRLISVQQR
ncbi:MAG TPA: tRNA (adenosine(37)-N6)-threonylcarbamoyltransferase complex ATPase subunit type 1 TsaE [Dysgonamonadaceae bacterium]|nr:tRNA (adenosine(37)-N6)-threonylcarbamoyltransferase complex ATPase subunit type 1 TsaE [Dysgonamonadaceae bacterium]